MPDRPVPLRSSAARFADLNVAELQQLLAAVIHAHGYGLFARGPGNLLPGLEQEISVALTAALERSGDV